MDISVVIVNYNRKQVAEDCIRSIQKFTDVLWLECRDTFKNISINPSLIIVGIVLLACNVFIIDHFQDSDIAPNYRDFYYSKGKLAIIENNVWIGEDVTIVSNLVNGMNYFIGANSVVTKSFLPNSIIGGVPAKLIRTL